MAQMCPRPRMTEGRSRDLGLPGVGVRDHGDCVRTAGGRAGDMGLLGHQKMIPPCFSMPEAHGNPSCPAF